jgi:methylase of polypeptide subunit release factors
MSITNKNINFSDQALGAVMLALQNSLMHQSDIVPILKGFNFVFDDNDELIVTNPPILRAAGNEETSPE